MPKKNGVGYGKYTSIKIEHLSKIMEMHLAVTQAVLNRYPAYNPVYHYIDATAGQGFTPDGIPGSPLIFLRSVANFQVSYRADLIECLEGNIDQLKIEVKKLSSTNGWSTKDIQYHLGEYEKIIPAILPSVVTRQYGLLYVDPSGDSPNFDTLNYVARVRPKMDILIYISATNIKRQYPKNQKLLSDFMSQVGKKYWLIRKPIKGDPHQWTFLLGSKGDIFRKYKSIDFLRFDSEEAQSFFPKLNLNKEQLFRQNQPSLFDDNELVF